MRAIRSKLPRVTKRKGPTSWSSWTLPPATRGGPSCSTSSAARRKSFSCRLCVGGGIRTIDDIRALLNAGSDKVSINSAAPRDPEFVREAARRFGSQCIVVNIDPKRVQRDGRTIWEVHINGGRVPTGLEAVAWAREVERLGAGEIVLTSMDADGTKNGYDLELTAAVSAAVSIPVVASGGAGRPEHLADAILLGKADAALGRQHFPLRRVYN